MYEKLPNTHGEDVLPIQHRGMGSIPNQHFKVSQVLSIIHILLKLDFISIQTFAYKMIIGSNSYVSKSF